MAEAVAGGICKLKLGLDIRAGAGRLAAVPQHRQMPPGTRIATRKTTLLRPQGPDIGGSSRPRLSSLR